MVLPRSGLLTVRVSIGVGIAIEVIELRAGRMRGGEGGRGVVKGQITDRSVELCR